MEKKTFGLTALATVISSAVFLPFLLYTDSLIFNFFLGLLLGLVGLSLISHLLNKKSYKAGIVITAITVLISLIIGVIFLNAYFSHLEMYDAEDKVLGGASQVLFMFSFDSYGSLILSICVFALGMLVPYFARIRFSTGILWAAFGILVGAFLTLAFLYMLFFGIMFM